MEALSSRRPPVAHAGVAAATQAHAAFDLKGIMSSTTVMRLRSRDLGLIERQLRNRVTQFPQFFENAPMVLDFAGLQGKSDGIALAALARMLRARGVVPVGVTNLGEGFHEEAIAAGLGIIKPAGPAALRLEQEEEAARKVGPTPAAPVNDGPTIPNAAMVAPEPVRPIFAHRPPMVVRQPVRSGQEVYARGTDLIVLAAVNPGAQVIADGHVHVYAPLRGRAIAGAAGFPEARIFCQKLEAELICIAGAYMLADDLPADRLGRAVQVFIEHGECHIVPL
ncbi:MAG: septum site-determining protein MinC [Deltaproteobacteria bacterium]|nr:septum site-determining protein MinC [Deltaproteobacteria bacterium]